MSPSEPELQLWHLILGIGIALFVLFGVVVPLYVRFMRSRRSGVHRVSEREADEYRPYENRLVLSVMANNRRPGCVIGLSLALIFGLLLVGMALAAGWEDYDWFGRGSTIAFSLIAFAVLILMLINFFKNMGRREYKGREVQLDDRELIIDRSLIDSETAGDDMFHPHLKRYLHKKMYYRIPLHDIKLLLVSAKIHQVAGKPHEFPFLYVFFTTFDAVYMIQTRFMGGQDEMRFLKHLEKISKLPLQVDERYAEHYEYLDTAVVVRLEQ